MGVTVLVFCRARVLPACSTALFHCFVPLLCPSALFHSSVHDTPAHFPYLLLLLPALIHLFYDGSYDHEHVRQPARVPPGRNRMQAVQVCVCVYVVYVCAYLCVSNPLRV